MRVYKDLSDGELALRLDEYDKAALEEIYLRYFDLLYLHARKMLRDDAAAQDLVQDLFINIAKSMGGLNITMVLSAYLYRAIRNHVIKLYHKDANRQKYVSSMKSYYKEGQYVTDEAVLENEMKRRIELAVKELPPKMREIFEMSRKAELSYREIAEASHISEETVKTQIKRALKILRTKLSAFFI